MFLGFTSFTFPPTPYRYSFKDGTLAEFEKVEGTVDSAAYEVEQVWAPSKDGTKISMFLVHKRGLPRDGQRPTLLTGYGGFNVDMTPSYSSARFVWLERGGLAGHTQPARRRRVRRGLAPGGDAREEAERLRRLHRRRGVAHQERLHAAASGWPSRAAATAACWWAR